MLHICGNFRDFMRAPMEDSDVVSSFNQAVDDERTRGPCPSNYKCFHTSPLICPPRTIDRGNDCGLRVLPSVRLGQNMPSFLCWRLYSSLIRFQSVGLTLGPAAVEPSTNHPFTVSDIFANHEASESGFPTCLLLLVVPSSLFNSAHTLSLSVLALG